MHVRNPFNVTKAVDFSDEQIAGMWVDFGGEGGFRTFVAPTSLMPHVLLGGKGSGRTHLMRYYSAPLQRLRAEQRKGQVREEGYLGIYLRCSGLNSGRFSGKGIGDETWDTVFAYAMDLTLAELAIRTALETFPDAATDAEAERVLVEELCGAFDTLRDVPTRIRDVVELLARERRELDAAVNEAAMPGTRGELRRVEVRATRGRLPLTVPRAFAAAQPALGQLTWLYLVDELENLTERQQRYVQTLVREKELPTSFMLGSRTYGFRTRETYSAGEINRPGSEFEELRLDAFFLEHEPAFGRFCRELVARRLLQASAAHTELEAVAAALDAHFSVPGPLDASFVRRAVDDPSKHFTQLARQLSGAGAMPPHDVDAVLAALSFPEDPVKEKLNVLLLYQTWPGDSDVKKRAAQIGHACRRFAAGEAERWYQQKWKHHKRDMYAQLRREHQQRQQYLGMDSFIAMAGGLPRNVLVILKNVYARAEFDGQAPFTGTPISDAAQTAGVHRAAAWFLEDNLPLGALGRQVERAVDRLGGLLRVLRFANRPPEIDSNLFSIDTARLSDTAVRTLKAAQDHSLLVQSERGQRDRNDGLVIEKFRLSPMLCPRFDLPLVMGGALRLSAHEGEAIFGDAESRRYDELRLRRERRATFPFRTTAGAQPELFSDNA